MDGKSQLNKLPLAAKKSDPFVIIRVNSRLKIQNEGELIDLSEFLFLASGCLRPGS